MSRWRQAALRGANDGQRQQHDGHGARDERGARLELVHPDVLPQHRRIMPTAAPPNVLHVRVTQPILRKSGSATTSHASVTRSRSASPVGRSAELRHDREDPERGRVEHADADHTASASPYR